MPAPGARGPRVGRRGLLAASGALAAAGAPATARAQANTIRLGVLTDMSGPYRDTTGPGSVALTQQAVQDFGSRGFQVEVVAADHQNKPDVGSNVARQWFDQGVDAVVDLPTSSVALAVNQIAREKNKVHLNSGAATSDLTGAQCSPNTVHWTYDTYMLAKSTGAAVVKTGGDSWFFITADYAFGHALERDTANFVRAQGGRVLGTGRYPFPATTDFSAFLLQAQASKAKVLGLANASTDTVNAIKGAREFGLHRSMKLAALLMGVADVKSLGLDAGQGLLLTESFYWDLNERTRALTQRVRAKNGDRPPAMVPAGCGRRHGRGGGQGERRRGGEPHEGHALRRRRLRTGAHPRRRPQDPSGLPVRGEGAGRVARSLGPVQARRHRAGGRSVPPAGRGRLHPAAELTTARIRGTTWTRYSASRRRSSSASSCSA
jgi:branched-chain amino acid transport system substrate-binding protein